MKQTIIYILFSVTIIFVGCGKYDEGPKFSLLTKTQRLTGEWEHEKVLVNGEIYEYEDKMIRETVEFRKDKSYYSSEKILLPDVDMLMYGIEQYGYFTITYSGEWNFDSKKENVLLSYTYDSLYLGTDDSSPYGFIHYVWKAKKVNDTRDLLVLRLTNNQFWFTYQVNDSTECYVELSK